MTTNEKPTLLSALLAVQAEIPSLSLGRSAEGQIGSRKYRYLPLDKLHAEVMPLLNKHGLVWITRPMDHDKGPVLYYELKSAATATPEPLDAVQGYRASEAIGGVMPLILGEQTSQALGSAITYARRYALLAVLGLAPVEEDDDGAAASTKASLKPVISQDRSAASRLLTDKERADLVAIIQASEQNPQLLLASVGVEKSDELTVKMGEDIMKKLRA